jgi:hypothetical protein
VKKTKKEKLDYIVRVRVGDKPAFFSFEKEANRKEFIEEIQKKVPGIEWITTETPKGALK